MSDADVIRELTESAEAMGAFGGNEDRFRAVVDAFRAKDADTFQRLLGEAKILERCERVCHWLRSKECVLLCLELCGPPLEVELPEPREFAQVVARITADEELVERLANLVEERDAEGFKVFVSELKIERFCHLLCHWVCTVHYRLICEIVCAPAPSHRIGLVDELTQAGAALGALAANEKVFSEVSAAALRGNCEILRGAVESANLGGQCHWICEWFCGLRCVRVCFLLCRSFPLEGIESPLSEAYEFAQVSARLAAEPAVLERLTNAVETSDEKAFQAIIDERHLGRFCIQLCHWICFCWCERFCRCVCPDPTLNPLFRLVGDVSIFSDINTPGTGRTKSAGASWGKDYAFYNELRLGGFCPAFRFGAAMSYRFLYAPSGSAAPPVPITSSSRVDNANARYVPWPIQGPGNTVGPLGTFPQSLTLDGSALPPGNTPAPLPVPISGPVWSEPPAAVIGPDANGWIAVDPNASGQGFGTLLGFDTTTAVPGGAPHPAAATQASLAGNPAPNWPNPPGTSLPGGTPLRIIFQATRTSTVAAVNAGGTPDFSNVLETILINNWDEINALWFVEYATGCCTPIDNTLGVKFTVDHEEMGAGSWSLEITSCALPTPDVLTPSSLAATAMTTGAQVFPTGTLVVNSTAGFPTSGQLYIAGVTGVVSYTGITATAFTGCTGGSGTAFAGAAVTYLNRGGSGTINENTSTWAACSYTVTLTTQPGLTTGLQARPADPNPLTFCICGH